MKKLIILLFLLAICTVGMAQEPFSGFFKPVDKQMFQKEVNGVKSLENAYAFKFRPAIEVTAVQLTWNKLTKQFDASALSSAGLGVSLQHFVELPDGTAFNNFGFNALLLLNANVVDPEPASMAVALTGNFLNFVSLGGLYNFSTKSFGILTGVAINF